MALLKSKNTDTLSDFGQDLFACVIAILIVVTLYFFTQVGAHSSEFVQIVVPPTSERTWRIVLEFDETPSEETQRIENMGLIATAATNIANGRDHFLTFVAGETDCVELRFRNSVQVGRLSDGTQYVEHPADVYPSVWYAYGPGGYYHGRFDWSGATFKQDLCVDLNQVTVSSSDAL